MPLPSVLALAALAMGMIRVALPHSGLNVPIWVARGTLILALVFLTVALVGFFWPVLGAYRLELVSRGGGGNAAEMTWPLALACAGIAYGALTVGGRLRRGPIPRCGF